jgi:cellulose synthase/poly-beta-1,6-N-acetylglucosamine synthase-like glycosyltransferase
MIAFFEITALLLLITLFYIYAGYPLLLVVLRCIRDEQKVNKKEIFPNVSMLISCFNEEDVIRKKLENALALDYPKDKLELVVISDASTDRTDDIVREFADQGVRLIRQNENLGKTLGLNLAVPQVKGEVIVFSDANAMYKPDAISKIVRNFNDDKVGYVVGEARYSNISRTAASKSESAYWKFEIWMKKMESYINSVVGGDGAIYAIRRELYEKLHDTDINDFVNPLQIILKGYRGIYESEAICMEESAGQFVKEFNRKVRIVNRSFSGLMRIRSVLNPFKTGFFSLGVISHKLLRWFAPAILIMIIISCFVLSFFNIAIYQWLSLLLSLFIIFSYVGYLFAEQYKVSIIFYYPYYFVMVSVASLIALQRSLSGKVQTTWTTSRVTAEDKKESYSWTKGIIHVSFFVVLWFFLSILGYLAGIPLLAERFIFWIAFIVVLYVYAGYPMALKIRSEYYSHSVQYKDIFPDVTLLICAYNEEEIIKDKIRNCFEIDYPSDKLEIVIASDGSTDRTTDIIEKFEDERLILFKYPERRGKISVINETVSKLDSEIIMFSDANTMYQKDAVKKLVRNFNDPSVGAVSADVILHNEETTYGKSESLYYLYERWIQKRESEIGSIIGADGGMYAIRRKLFVPPSPNIILDDFVISMNIVLSGYRLVYEKEAVGHEQSSSSSKIEFIRKSRIIAGAIQSVLRREGVPTLKQKGLLFCYVSHKFLRWMIPIILIVLFISNLRLVLSLGGTIYITTFLAQVLLYLLAVSDLLIVRKFNISLTSIPFYFCLVNSAALYGLYKGMFNKQSVKWQKFGRQPGSI